MKKITPFLFAFASSFLLWAAWPSSGFSFLIFFAWFPLLWLEEIVESRKKFFGYTYLTMLLWNVSTTWWIWNASAPGAIAAFLANSLLMCFPWLGYKITKKHLGSNFGYLSLIAFWMCFEYIHLQDWGLSWPWLTLGNVFASDASSVMWYQYTGVSGGTLWVLLTNIILFSIFKEYQFHQRSKKYFTLLASWLLLLVIPPTLFNSFKIKNSLEENALRNVVIVQPNIDPYEKISTGSFDAQLEKLIQLSEEAIDSNTSLVVWPETALYMGNGIDEKNIRENFLLNPLWGFLKRHPQVSLFTGVESYREFDRATKQSQEFDGNFYEAYNAAALMDSSGASAFYHKSMLVPGVETLPWFLRFIDKWFVKFGGTTAGYAKQSTRTVLNEKNGFKIAPSICYESIYGEFMSQYVKNGANLICIITNDGWWKNTPGHLQHNDYARLRAVETNTWVVRCANTGISSMIDNHGNIRASLPYNKKGEIKYNVPIISSAHTFYTRNGDILSKLMVLLSGAVILWVLILKFRRKK